MDAAAATGTPANARGIAVKLWAAARSEFSLRGYHGARVQGIARRAGCNVALLYRHWASKRALYLEVLKSVWTGKSAAVSGLAEKGSGAPAVVGAYLDAFLSDPEGAQILVREYLDGGPFLSQLVASDPAIVDPLRLAVAAFGPDGGVELRAGVDPALAALTVAGLAALVASAPEATRAVVARTVSVEGWRDHLDDLLLHGLLRP